MELALKFEAPEPYDLARYLQKLLNNKKLLQKIFQLISGQRMQPYSENYWVTY